MSTRQIGYGAFAALVALTIGACNNNRNANRADTTAAGGEVSHAADSLHDSLSAAAHDTTHARNGWTDAEIVGFVNAANAGEISAGELAERKATNPDVKAFARLMVADHKAMLNDSKALASKLNITPDSSNDKVRDLVKSAQDDNKDLKDKAAGKDWDEDYMSKQVDGHEHVLDQLQDAAKSTSNAQLRAELEKAVGKVQTHLTKAKDIKDNKLKA